MSQEREKPCPGAKKKCKGYPKEYREESLQIRKHVLSRVNMETN